MKGIYLTQEGKEKLEDRIAELEKWSKRNGKVGEYDAEGMMASELKEILSSAIILPVEESYNSIQHFETLEYGTIIRKHFLMANYSQGVIIQPKQ
jgi:hypothetical protein